MTSHSARQVGEAVGVCACVCVICHLLCKSSLIRDYAEVERSVFINVCESL